MEYQDKTTKTLGHLRSINPSMINHFASQSQTRQLLKIKMHNGPAQHQCMAISMSPCCGFLRCMEWISFSKKGFVLNIERKLRKVQAQVELMRINFKFEAPILQVQIILRSPHRISKFNGWAIGQYLTEYAHFCSVGDIKPVLNPYMWICCHDIEFWFAITCIDMNVILDLPAAIQQF